jgi:hypothetical protein
VIDAAGAIYVIGGGNRGLFDTEFQDVWASTDGGVRGSRGWSGDALGGYSGGY